MQDCKPGDDNVPEEYGQETNPTALPDPRVAIRQDRAAAYGPAEQIAHATGLAIQATLSAYWGMKTPPIPPHIVELIMVQVKAMRAAVPYKFKHDTYDDLHIYADLAKELDPRSKEQTNG